MKDGSHPKAPFSRRRYIKITRFFICMLMNVFHLYVYIVNVSLALAAFNVERCYNVGRCVT